MSIGIVVNTEGFTGGTDASEYFDSELDGDDAFWLPERGIGREFPDVPKHIAGPADEAYRCDSVRAYRAAVILARAVIEATAKDKGFNKGTLEAKVEALAVADLVRPSVKDAANEIRYVGNDMAHGDFATEITSEDADLTLELMTTVLTEVYVDPARLEAARARREQRRAGSANK